MNDTDLTFSKITSHSPFKIVNDDSKPGWDELLHTPFDDDVETDAEDKNSEIKS